MGCGGEGPSLTDLAGQMNETVQNVGVVRPLAETGGGPNAPAR
jgi:hypothetical protein